MDALRAQGSHFLLWIAVTRPRRKDMKSRRLSQEVGRRHSLISPIGLLLSWRFDSEIGYSLRVSHSTFLALDLGGTNLYVFVLLFSLLDIRM